MKEKIIKLFLILAVVPWYAAFVENFSSNHNSDAVDEPLSSFVYIIDNDTTEIILKLKNLLPEYQWSSKFKALCEEIKNKEIIAVYEDVDQIIKECLEACNNLPHDQVCFLQTHLENYIKILHEDTTHIYKEDDQDQTVTQRGKNTVTMIRRLKVECLAIKDKLFGERD
jgi:CTP:phosphocholine cytidylyltransferase-like protein